MRSFLLYTGLRIALFLATFAVVTGVWTGVAGEADLFWSAIISFLISGVAALFLLNGPRRDFAEKVERRASNAVDKVRSKED